MRVSRVTDLAGLGVRWRDLEQRADPSFFQSWTWTGCLAAERFTDPVLVSVEDSGRTVAMALFNRVRRVLGLDWLHLGESGDPERDSPFIEHNGVLAETGREDILARACFRVVARSHVLVLSGIDQANLDAVRAVAGEVLIVKATGSPFVDLAALRHAGMDFLSRCSANTRQQIRRSDRSYAQHRGLTFHRAGSLPAAHAMLRTMAELHQATWIARGRPGSFARPFFARFHHALIEEGFPRGEIALTAAYAGDHLIGVLYNLSLRGRVLAYQSGFDYRMAEAHEKPGLTCHHGAIQQALESGSNTYDFLAGDDRYKHSLADRSVRQYWVEAGPAWAPHLAIRRMRIMSAELASGVHERWQSRGA